MQPVTAAAFLPFCWASAPRLGHLPASIVEAELRPFPQANDKSCCLHVSATVVKKKDSSPLNIGSASPAWCVSRPQEQLRAFGSRAPGISARQSAGDSQGGKRLIELAGVRLCKSGRLRPVPGCLQTSPSMLPTNSSQCHQQPTEHPPPERSLQPAGGHWCPRCPPDV